MWLLHRATAPQMLRPYPCPGRPLRLLPTETRLLQGTVTQTGQGGLVEILTQSARDFPLSRSMSARIPSAWPRQESAPQMWGASDFPATPGTRHTRRCPSATHPPNGTWVQLLPGPSKARLPAGGGLADTQHQPGISGTSRPDQHTGLGCTDAGTWPEATAACLPGPADARGTAHTSGPGRSQWSRHRRQ